MAHSDKIPIVFKHMGKQRCGESWTLTGQNTLNWPDLDLWYLVDGFGELETPEKEILPLQPGTCLIMRGGHPYNFRRTSRQPFTHYWVHFSFLDELDRIIPPNQPQPMGLYRKMQDTHLLDLLLTRAIEANRSISDARSTALAWLWAAILEIQREDKQANQNTLNHHSDYDHGVEHICKLIMENPAIHLDMNDLCNELHCSRAHVYRRFKQYTGRSPQQFAIDTRMQAAHFLLLDSNLPIAQIASQLGYTDVYFFSRQFKQHHDVSPAAFRKSPNSVSKKQVKSESSWQTPC